MPVAADMATVLALVGAFFGWQSFKSRRLEMEQWRERAARERDFFWRRISWAIDLATSEREDRQLVGLRYLNTLASSSEVTAEDLNLIDALTGFAMGSAFPGALQDAEEPRPEGSEEAEKMER